MNEKLLAQYKQLGYNEIEAEALHAKGITPEEIALAKGAPKVNAEEEEGPVEEAAMEAAKKYGKELKKQIRIRMDDDMDIIKKKFEIDRTITPVYDLYIKTLRDEIEYFV